MHLLQNLSIRSKLIAVILVTSAAGLVVMGVSLLTYDWFALRRSTQHSVIALADVLANASTAAFSFNDPEEATEVLSALKAHPNVSAAALYNAQGTLFASYRPPGSTAPLPERAPTVGARIREGRLQVLRPVILNDKRLGSIYLERVLVERRTQIQLYVLVSFLALGMALLVVWALSANLQQLISLPIVSLAKTARTVSEQRDYSVRAEKFSGDELGGLTDSFNQMLAAIQARDATLHHAYDTVLREVTERKRTQEALRLDESRLETLVRLNQMTEAPLAELTEFALAEAVKLTHSRSGFVAFLSADGSTAAMHIWPPPAQPPPMSLAVEKIEPWVRVLRRRAPLMVNEGQPVALPPEVPAPNLPLIRYLCVPVFDGERIVALAGVDTKPEPYEDADLRQLTLLMQGMWRLIQRRRAEEELRRHRDHLEDLVTERTAELKQTNEQLSREIETRKRAEEMLVRQAQELQRQAELLQLTHDAIFVRDLDDQIIFWNRGAEELYGWTQDQALHKQARDLLKTRFPAERAAIVVELMQKARWDGELTQITKDGRELVVDSRWALLRDYQGQPSGILEINTDISQRKQAEEAVRRERDKAQTYLDIVGVMLLVLNRDGTVALVNKQGCRLLGYPERELLGRDWFELALPAEVRDRVRSVFTAAMRGGQELPEQFENIIVTKQGEQRRIYWHNIVLRDDQGQPTGSISSGEDVTEQRRADRRLKETAAALARSNRELEQFAYVASHDLREPLRMVASYVQLLSQRYRGKLDADADQFIGFAVDGARRMQALIDDLLHYARIETRGKPLQPVDTNRVVQIATSNLQIAIQEAQAQIEILDPLPTVAGDDTQLTQLFQNLLSNAVKFRRPEVPPRIRISAQPSGADWQFSVADNGIGIEPQYHERIFVIFQRLHTREQYSGTGIGLALCKKIVERHGGRIWVESQIGAGAAFHFTLPAAGPDQGRANEDLLGLGNLAR